MVADAGEGVALHLVRGELRQGGPRLEAAGVTRGDRRKGGSTAVPGLRSRRGEGVLDLWVDRWEHGLGQPAAQVDVSHVGHGGTPQATVGEAREVTPLR